MYKHPQIDGKVNHHWMSRDLLVHLFGDDYIACIAMAEKTIQYWHVRSESATGCERFCTQPMDQHGGQSDWLIFRHHPVDFSIQSGAQWYIQLWLSPQKPILSVCHLLHQNAWLLGMSILNLKTSTYHPGGVWLWVKIRTLKLLIHRWSFHQIW